MRFSPVSIVVLVSSLLLFSGRSPVPQEAVPGTTAQEQQDLDYAQVRERAEEYYGEGSYELARRLYEQASELDLQDDEDRWVQFRLADTAWRSAAATQNPDTTVLQRAATELQRMVAAVQREEDRDVTWAEAHESLGHYHWNRSRSQNWGGAWTHYQAALDFWAGSSDVDQARRRYLDIVFAAAQPVWHREYWGRGVYGNYLPVEFLESAVDIAERSDDRVRAHFLLGMYYFNWGQNNSVRGRVERELSQVLELGKESEWYDDALYHLANYLENYGRAERNENGQWVWTQDFAEAVTLYRRLLREFHRGETSYHDDATSRIRQITEPTLWVSVDQFFLPDSEVSYRLNWRNLENVELALFPADLTSDVDFENAQGPGSWLDAIQLERLEAKERWKHETGDTGLHHPGQAELVFDEKLPAGAWVLEVTGGGKRARALVLVSDVALTAKATDQKILAWLTDVRTGEPVADASVRLWQRFWSNGSYRWRERGGQTESDGTYLFELGRTDGYGEYFVAASSEGRQAFAHDSTNQSPTGTQSWRIYAHTDRSAYRPNDEVNWKFVARRYDGSRYSTPANEMVEWEIFDPMGATVEKGESELNAFGAAWSMLVTNDVMHLGEYRIQFHQNGKNGREYIGDATLFRLEEYKLPEFEVSVRVPEDPAGSGRPKLFALGDRVEAEVDASYYFGGPVAAARVEVFVYQKPYYHTWKKEREFPWFYEQAYNHWWGGHGQQIAHKVLKTDLAGRARLVFETPQDSGQDFEYTIEARVVDASRREVIGNGTVRVTRNEYFVQVETKHAIHRPGAAIDVTFATVDPGGNPVQAEGELKVTRERWIEVWRDPSGKEIRGEELSRRRRDGVFPPPGEPGYWIEFQGYEQDVVATATVRTNDTGRGAWEFTPDRDGTYRIAWHSVDGRGGDVESVATVFVADEATRELGYLPGGIEILVDKDTLAVGEDAVFVLAAPASGRWVLFTVEGEDLYHHEVIRLDGTVKLVRHPITELHVPNVFLGAVSLADGQAYEDREELIIPPVSQFLDVDVTLDRESYLPGQEGALAVAVTDSEGNPVAVELSLAVVDDALAYIQGDYAGDPRRFFYGRKRGLLVRTRGTVHHGWYRRLVRKNGEVVDERDALRQRHGKDWKKEGGRRQSGYEHRDDGRSRAAEKGAFAPGLASNAPMDMEEGMSFEQTGTDLDDRGQAGDPGDPNVRVRSDFRETALWLPDVVTDEEGRASVPIRFPDSTTRWRTTVRAADTEARFGTAGTTVKTRQPLIARLQAPRFFLVGDEVVLSGNLNNNTESVLTVRASLEAAGLEVLGRLDEGRIFDGEADQVEIPANGTFRVDWRVRVLDPGEAVLRLTAVGDEYGDAVERRLPVYPHGIEALVAEAGKLDKGRIAFDIELPAERRLETTSLTIQVAPSLAVTMLDALPYLVDYPYGCTEQTLSRFLPAVIVAKTMRDFGLSAEDAMERVFGGIEREFVDRTHPEGRKNLERLDEMVQRGLERLYDFQHADGGWAWWKEGDSDRFMTAYVLWGLSLAREAGVDVRTGVLENAARWLAEQLVEEENAPDSQAWLLHALAVYGGETGDSRSPAWMEKAFENLWKKRDGLNAYSRSLFALAAHAMGRTREAEVLVQNLINGVDVDETPDTSIVRLGTQTSKPYVLKMAHWGEDGIQHRWSEGGVEATAFALRALVAVDPEHELVDPVTNWLVRNRRGAQWSNTRDTAICVLALNDYLRASGELASDVAYEVTVNGIKVAEHELSKDELLRAPSEFSVDLRWIRDGKNQVQITKTRGDGPLYFAAYARFFSLEDPIPPRGHQLFARREYYRLVGRPTLLKGFVYDRVPLGDGDAVLSGERIEVVVTVETKNNLEYLVFEDLKPAGFEAVQVRSGEPFVARELQSGEATARFAEDGEKRRKGSYRESYDRRIDGSGYTGRSRSVHQELRDRKVAFFVDALGDGFWELRYDLRAEVPGRFHALPLLGHAMYVPEIRCNGRELRLEVRDASAE